MKPALLIIVLITILASCKKDNSIVVGRWNEVKLRVYSQDKTTGAILSDTTYQANNFGRFDYAQFNADGTCSVSNAALSYSGETPVTVQQVENFTYRHAGSGFALTEIFKNSVSTSETLTVQTVTSVTSGTLIIHTVGTSINPSVTYTTVDDAYYSK